MANWFKVAGIILIVIGLVIVILNPIVVYQNEEVGGHPWETNASAFFGQFGLGIVLILVGVLLYYFGRRKEKGLVPAPKPPN